MKLFHKTRPQTAEARILDALRKAGKHGMYGYELARPNVGALAWHRRITDLRCEGFNIQTVRISKGNFKYYLIEKSRLD